MKLPVVDSKGKKIDVLAVADEIFTVPMNEQLVAQAIHVFRTNLRRSKAKALTRGEVYGSRRKLWKQKGTGRARHGDRFAPQFVGGGVAHGPTGIENYHRNLNKKMRWKALLCLLSQKAANGDLIVVEGLDKVKRTAQVAKIVSNLLGEASRKYILVIDKHHQDAARAAKNLDGAVISLPENLNAFTVLAAGKMIVDKDSIKSIEANFSSHSQGGPQ